MRKSAPAGLAIMFLGAMPFLPLESLGPGYRFVIFPAVTLLAAIAIDTGQHSVRVARVLAWHPLQYLGIRAYSTYLWHMPVFWMTYLLLRDLPSWGGACAGVALVVPVVGASFRYLERPWLSAQPRGRRITAPAAATDQRQPATASLHGWRGPAPE